MAGSLPPTLSELRTNPNFVVRDVGGNIVVTSKPQSYIRERDSNTLRKADFVENTYTYDSSGNLISAQRQKVIRESTSGGSALRQRVETVEEINRLKSGEYERVVKEVVSTKRGREQVKFMEREVFNQDLSRGELVESRNNVSVLQRQNRGEVVRGSVDRVAAVRAEAEERRNLNVALRSVGANTVTKQEFRGIGKGGRADVAKQVSDARTYNRIYGPRKMGFVAESPAEMALGLKVSEQYVSGSAGFNMLRSRRLSEKLSEVDTSQAVSVTLGGAEYSGTVTIPPETSYSAPSFSPFNYSSGVGETRTDLGTFKVNEVLGVPVPDSVDTRGEVEEVGIAMVDARREGRYVAAWQLLLEKNRVASMRMSQESVGDWRASFKANAALFVTTAASTAFAISPFGIGVSLKNRGVLGTVADYNPFVFAEDLIEGKVITARTPGGVAAQVGGLALGFEAGGRATTSAFRAAKWESARFERKVAEESHRLSFEAWEKTITGEKFTVSRFESVRAEMRRVRSVRVEPIMEVVGGETRFNPRYGEVRSSVPMFDLVMVDVKPKLTVLDRGGKVRGVQTQLGAGDAIREVPKAVSKPVMQTSLSDFEGGYSKLVVTENTRARLLRVGVAGDVSFNPSYRGGLPQLAERVSVTERFVEPFSLAEKAKVKAISDFESYETKNTFYGESVTRKVRDVPTSLPARYTGRQSKLTVSIGGYKKFNPRFGDFRVAEAYNAEVVGGPGLLRHREMVRRVAESQGTTYFSFGFGGINKRGSATLLSPELLFKERKAKVAREEPIRDDVGERLRGKGKGVYDGLPILGIRGGLDSLDKLRSEGRIGDKKKGVSAIKLNSEFSRENAGGVDISVPKIRQTPDYKRKVSQITIPKIGIDFDTFQVTKPGGGTGPAPRPPPSEPPPKKMMLRRRGDDDKESDKLDGYDVLVKERGRYVAVSDEPLPRKAAFNLGARVTDQTTAATFKLRKAGKARRPYDDAAISNRDKFTDKGNFFVEKNKNRIDTPGEFAGVTVKGWKSRRKKMRI